MIKFFRDILDGPLYIVVAILSIFFIMAIIGFLMERKKLEEEEKAKIAVVSNTDNITPIQPVDVQTKHENTIISNEQIQQIPISNLEQEKTTMEVKTPVIIFEDKEQGVE